MRSTKREVNSDIFVILVTFFIEISIILTPYLSWLSSRYEIKFVIVRLLISSKQQGYLQTRYAYTVTIDQ